MVLSKVTTTVIGGALTSNDAHQIESPPLLVAATAAVTGAYSIAGVTWCAGALTFQAASRLSSLMSTVELRATLVSNTDVSVDAASSSLRSATL